MVKLTQVHKIQIYLFYSLGSIKKSLEPWNNGLYLSSFIAQNVIPKILLGETSLDHQSLAARGRPVWPVCPTGLTGHVWQLLFYPLHGPHSKNLIPFTTPPTPLCSPLCLTCTRHPVGDLEFQSRKRRSLCGIWTSSPAWPCSQAGPSSSSSKSCSKGTYGLFYPDLLF